MPGPGLAITVVGDDAGVQAMLMALDTALNPVAIAGFLSGVVDPFIRQRAGERFRTEGDDASGAWAPLAPATQNIRSQMGYGAAHPINRREGELEYYVTETDGGVKVHPFGATLMYPASYPGGDLGEKLMGAQMGGVGPSGRRYPSRKVYALGTEDLTFVLLALAQHVKTVGRKALP